MLKKSLFAAAIVLLFFVLGSDPSVLAAGAETTEPAAESDGFIRIVLNVLSVATLAVMAYLIVTDRG
ncbi:hypothetical protein NSQ26_05380 [Bacillus sp. FSL W7-1360]